uniref:Uncharacterized protein n=1 Tax=Anguilla anguilla TaxID=7936 RepID=A0A0E9RQP4_ANGAN
MFCFENSFVFICLITLKNIVCVGVHARMCVFVCVCVCVCVCMVAEQPIKMFNLCAYEG